MKTKPSSSALLWILASAALMFGAALVGSHFQPAHKAAELLASRGQRLELVQHMRSSLASSGLAEKSAVLAVTDEDSQRFADESRSATAEVEHARAELQQVLSSAGTGGERQLLDQFSEAFLQLQHVDESLLALSVKNTNLKAYNLSFGPAANAIQAMDSALSRLIEKHAASTEAREVARLALRAQSGALRLQTMLAPHIAEESDSKMNALEARMSSEDKEVRDHLAALAALSSLHDDADLATASSSYASFSELRTQIIALSRENTNVRSLAMSLDQKRKVMFVCQAALEDLREAISDEPIPGVNYNPRAGLR